MYQSKSTYRRSWLSNDTAMPFVVEVIIMNTFSIHFSILFIVLSNNYYHCHAGELLFHAACRCLLHVLLEGYLFFLLPGQLHLMEYRCKLLTYPEFDVPICAIRLLELCASWTGCWNGADSNDKMSHISSQNWAMSAKFKFQELSHLSETQRLLLPISPNKSKGFFSCLCYCLKINKYKNKWMKT